MTNTYFVEFVKNKLPVRGRKWFIMGNDPSLQSLYATTIAIIRKRDVSYFVSQRDLKT
jgi:hypothetical protein